MNFNNTHNTDVRWFTRSITILTALALVISVTFIVSVPNARASVSSAMIGDSITVSVSSQLRSAIPGLRIDAEVSRPFSHAQSALSRINASGVPDVLIVALGTNNGVSTSQIDSFIASASGSGIDQIVLVNVRVPRDYEAPTNNVLASAAARYDYVSLANWYSLANPHDEWFTSGGYHLSATGKPHFVSLVAGAHGRAAAKVSSPTTTAAPTTTVAPTTTSTIVASSTTLPSTSTTLPASSTTIPRSSITSTTVPQPVTTTIAPTTTIPVSTTTTIISSTTTTTSPSDSKLKVASLVGWKLPQALAKVRASGAIPRVTFVPSTRHLGTVVAASSTSAFIDLKVSNTRLLSGKIFADFQELPSSPYGFTFVNVTSFEGEPMMILKAVRFTFFSRIPLFI